MAKYVPTSVLEGGDVNELKGALSKLVATVMARDNRIAKMHRDATMEDRLARAKAKRRWGKRYLMKTDSASQQVVNEFCTTFLFKEMKFLPTYFYLFSESKSSICQMVMRSITVPRNETESEYWTTVIAYALNYKMQMLRNQRLQKMKDVFQSKCQNCLLFET